MNAFYMIEFKMATKECDVLLVKKPIPTSIVWNYFGLEANEGGIPKANKDHKAVCCACKRSVPAKGVIRVILMSHQNTMPNCLSKLYLHRKLSNQKGIHRKTTLART